MRWLRRSFAARLLLALAVVGLVGAGLTALLVDAAFRSAFEEYLGDQQARRAAELEDTLAASYRRHDAWVPPDLHATTHGHIVDGAVVELREPGGGTLWSSERGAGGHGRHHQVPEEELGEAVFFDVTVDDELVGVAMARFPEPGVLPADRAFRTEINRTLVLGGLAAAAVALGVGLVLARRATLPARRLTEAAERLSVDRGVRVPDLGEDEFGATGRAFNRMAEDLTAQEALRRSFAADVAHELRTPLSVLRGRLEALQDGVAEPNAERIGELHDEALRLGRLVADLEALAAADAAGFALERRAVDLAEVVGRAAQGAGTALEGRLRVAAEAGLLVDGDPARLHQVVANLLSNAAKHAPRGPVEVRAERDGDEVALTVADAGPGIPDDELDAVFERFVRGRRAQAGGTGIGLTVVRDLVAAHGGRVELDRAPAGGLVARVRLPALDASRDGQGQG